MRVENIACWRKKREKKTGIEITALSKCAMTLWLLDHEQFWAFQRLKHTKTLSLSFYPWFPFCRSLKHSHPHTPVKEAY